MEKPMSVKLTSAEMKALYADKGVFPKGSYVEDEVIWVNGEEIDTFDFEIDKLQNTDAVLIYGGSLYNRSPRMWDGRGPGESFEAEIRRWLKARKIVSFLVTVDKSKEEAVRLAIKKAGGKVNNGNK